MTELFASQNSSTLSPSGSPLGLLDRRDLLRVGSLSIAATALPANLLAGESTGTSKSRAESVIYLWMGGGVTHIDSFDPKPEAPEQIRGTLDTIDTQLPGVHFTEAMPELAKIAADLAVIRSFSHDSNDHFLSQVFTLCGRRVTAAELFKHPNIGSIVSHLYGSRNGLPGYIAVPGITFPGPPPTNLFVGGWLGNQYAPFSVGGRPEQPDFTVGDKEENPSPLFEENLNPQELRYLEEMTSARIDRRARLRERLETELRGLEKLPNFQTLEGQYESAFTLLAGQQIREAFDVTKESDALRDRYGRTKLGGRCLLARRLVEAGARYVMVDYGYDLQYGNLWDNHAVPVQKQPHISEMCKRGYHLAGMDKAFAALISDLKERGLLDTTLVVFLTEFGRTPKINSEGGRDHWGPAGSVFFTGAGTKVGQVIGATDAQAAYPVSRSYTPADLAATIYAALGLDPEMYVTDIENRPHPLLDEGHPIVEVL
ncbi:MAG: DUF1501 domain-containing protein [Planctomycetota bacterium]|nr:DUF1501 domain-containing protein [Planctomycetota bacterium]MDA1212338.1 DUF1501 domain-containing protein [Planctomycetota bacterium]